MSSLRKDSPRTFLAAHDSAYSKPFSQIDCCIRLPRFTRGSVRILAYSRGSSAFLARTVVVRKAAGARRQTSEFDLAIVTSLITYVASSSDRFAGLRPSERRTGLSLHQDENRVYRDGSRHPFACLTEISRRFFLQRRTPRSRGRSFTGQSKLVGWQYVS